MSITIKQDATIYSFIIFLQTVLYVSDDNLIHYQEHPQTVITTGTGRNVLPDVVITVLSVLLMIYEGIIRNM